MKHTLEFILRIYRQIRGFLPSPLPTGLSDFTAWADDIAATYKLPTEDKDSIYFSFASQIMHLGPTAAYKPKYYFVVCTRAGAAKQVAGHAFYTIKEQQKARQASEAKAAEATALVGSDGAKPIGA